jgi:Mlc titration factor MtfA (ptsG expression regulator)
VLYPQQGVITVLHELGHAYNLRRTPAGSYAQVLLDPEMISFLNATNWKVLTPATEVAAMRDIRQVTVVLEGALVWNSLSHNDVLEDFATSFAYFFAAPDVLRDLSPARYEWFATHFGAR